MMNIPSKIRRNLEVVRKNGRFLDRNSLLKFYHGLIMSHIKNGIAVGHHSYTIILKIQAFLLSKMYSL